MAPRNTRAKAFAKIDEQPVKDYDPEGEISQDDGASDSGSQESEDENAGTEHYVSVGSSKLRQKDAPALGTQYRGSRVSRAALQETSDEDEEEEDDEALDGESGSEEFADPDEADLEADQDDEDAEIESDNALTQSDVDRFKDFTFRGSSKPKTTKERLASRPKASDFLTSSEDEGSEDEESGEGAHDLDVDSDEEMENGVVGSEDDEEDEDEEEQDEDEEDDEDEDDEDEDGSEGSADGDVDADAQREELRKIMTEGQKSIVATISQAAKADAEKGQAVRQQRRAFDALLNIRIRLQKALVAANSIETVEEPAATEEHKEPYEAAEEAAIKLLNSIDGFRRSMLPETAKAKIGQKRKRDFDADAASRAIWDSMEETEALALAHRRKVLDKWSSKVRTTTAMTTSRKLGPATSQSLVSILDDQLLGSSDRLIKRTRTPRSCAPIQATRKVAEDPNVYDDADFYQLLLKELVDQRTMDSASGTTDGAGVTVRWAALKEAKTRKQVDRKASKGRKLRFTVHEKLQNFMAPEDRRSWEQDAVDRFFGTLFGQKMELLGEEEASDEEMGGASVAEEGLRLFRN
ncbi:TRAUB-domain-containing protein [Coniochaeta ligniaria NRRL 30616]|uniref:Protein BFR2 n=1 Tax=Coniochaeta ligniaria NRRL 30616 TaxID=1408157 RepID=A0A1J7ITN8_9PEZI|nr:TRAUB-domain-containing protein [Coniochaeta ligniaria NRRL 30616]